MMYFSVFDIELNLLTDFVIVFIALFKFEVDKQSMMIIKSKQLVSLLLIHLQIRLKRSSISRSYDAVGAAVVAVTILRHK